jgi:hypothetical protein
MDLITQLPPSTEGYTAVAVFVDGLSKMARLAPCHDTTTAEQFADLFINTVFRSHGVPETLVSDRDTRFTSEFWAALTARLGVTRAMSSAFHPQTDGQTERVNRCVEDMLRHFIDPAQTNWARLLPLVEFAYNDSLHEATHAIPFVVNYGKRPALPLDWILRGEGEHADAHVVAVTTRAQRQVESVVTADAVAAEQEVPAGDASDSNDTESDALGEVSADMADPAEAASPQTTAHRAAARLRAEALASEIRSVMAEARKWVHAAQQRYKVFEDQKRVEVQYEVGEQVLLSTKNLSLKMQGTTKLLPRFIGPFTITERIGAVAYRLDLPPVLKVHNVFHVSLLKQYKPGRKKPPPLPIMVEGVPEFEVECILNHRRRGKTIQYQIKWLGYGQEHTSWEPESCVRNCPERINEYWARVAQREEHKRGAVGAAVELQPEKRRKQ